MVIQERTILTNMRSVLKNIYCINDSDVNKWFIVKEPGEVNRVYESNE